MLFGAHASIDLTTRGRQQIHLHAALGEARLHRLGDGDKRRLVFDVEGEMRLFDARFSEDIFGFCGLNVNGLLSSAPGRPTGRKL